MFQTPGAAWKTWSSRRHPRLLLLATASVAIVALILMFRISDAAMVLYKEF